MTFLMRVCGVAASVLMLTICSAVVAEAEPASQTNADPALLPATITLQISPGSTERATTTVTVEVHLALLGSRPRSGLQLILTPRHRPLWAPRSAGSPSRACLSICSAHSIGWSRARPLPAVPQLPPVADRILQRICPAAVGARTRRSLRNQLEHRHRL